MKRKSVTSVTHPEVVVNTYSGILRKNRLFQDLSEQDFRTLLEPDICILGHYVKNTVIAQEKEPCRSICFIMEGSLSFQQISATGEMTKIQVFHSGECFGFVLFFSSQPVYPYTIVTSAATKILYIPFEKIKALLDTSPAFNANCMIFLADTVQMFQRKIKILSQKDVRTKLIVYFAGVASRAEALSFQLPHTKTEIADLIGVARPSVSRELKHMQEAGLIALERNVVTLKKPEAFDLR
jgi:CRP-like cAMP-binding protein